MHDITVHYADEDGMPGDAVQDNALIEADGKLALRYTYEITGEQCSKITSGTPYYLEISPHLELPNLQAGSALTIESESRMEQFGMIYADGRHFSKRGRDTLRSALPRPLAVGMEAGSPVRLCW